MSDNKIGERIRDLRESLKLTQPELAAKLNVSRQVVSNWERGYTPNIPSEYIARLAILFNVTTDYILHGNSPESIIKDALKDDDELMGFFEELTKRDELKLLFKQVKPLKPDAIKRIIKYIKMIEDEEDSE